MSNGNSKAINWMLIIGALLPILVPIFLPMIEQWLGIDLDDQAIIALIQRIVELLIPSGAAAFLGWYGIGAYKETSLAKSEARRVEAQAALQQAKNNN